MKIPPISGPNPFKSAGEDPGEVVNRLRHNWFANPTKDNCTKLLNYIMDHYDELSDIAEDTADFLKEKGLPAPKVPFDEAYDHAIQSLRDWMDQGCDPDNISKEKTAVISMTAWVTGGVCEDDSEIEGSDLPSPASLGSSGSSGSVANRLEKWLDQYREVMQNWIDDPSKENLRAVKHCIHGKDGRHGLEKFLRDNKEAIFDLAQSQGWPTSDPGSDYEHYFQSTMNSMDNFMTQPNMGSLDQANECLTQLNWLIRNHA